MLKTFLTRYLDKFEKTFNYDASYMRHVLRVNPASLFKFSLGTQALDQKAAPAELLVAAGLYGTLTEDCGPCVQVGVDIATANGVDPQILRAVIAATATSPKVFSAMRAVFESPDFDMASASGSS